MNENLKRHNLIMENRQRLSVSGILDVASFDENEIILQTSTGLLNIKGEGLHIDNLSIDNGELNVNGKIYGILYHDEIPTQGGGFFSRLFK